MIENSSHDQIIARVQHFGDMLKQIQLEKESLFLIFSEKSTEKEQMKEQIIICEEIAKHYYEIFKDILYR